MRIGRNLPAIDGSSKLSPHFRFGTLSPRMAIHAALTHWPKGVGIPCLMFDLGRGVDLARVLSASLGFLSAHRSRGHFGTAAVPPLTSLGRERDRLFRDMVGGKDRLSDRGCRDEATQSNRMDAQPCPNGRRIIPDQRSSDRLAERRTVLHAALIDADVAANNGNWQWCAATGTDSMRGYRIFNPALQSKKFDPDGTYHPPLCSRTGQCTGEKIHEPHLMSTKEQGRYGCHIGVVYPAPVVDHRQARQEYLDLGKQRVTR